MKLVTKALLVASAIIMTTPAHAALLQFTISGRQQVSFTADSMPTPTVYFGNFGLNVNGTLGNDAITSIRFYTKSNSGGIYIFTSNSSLNTSGDQVFSGSLESPIFTPGTFNLTDGRGALTLTISALAVPEPATWTMMLVGFGMVGTAVRYRRRAARTIFA